MLYGPVKIPLLIMYMYWGIIICIVSAHADRSVTVEWRTLNFQWWDNITKCRSLFALHTIEIELKMEHNFPRGPFTALTLYLRTAVKSSTGATTAYRPHWKWRHHSKPCPTTWRLWACAWWCAVKNKCYVLQASLTYTFRRAYGLPYKIANFIATKGLFKTVYCENSCCPGFPLF